MHTPQAAISITPLLLQMPYTYIYIHTHTYKYTATPLDNGTNKYIHIYIYIYIYIVYIHSYIHIGSHTYMYIYMNAHTSSSNRKSAAPFTEVSAKPLDNCTNMVALGCSKDVSRRYQPLVICVCIICLMYVQLCI